MTNKDCKSKHKISIENHLTKKNLKRDYERIKYQNMSEENKRRLKECQRNYRKAKKST